MQFTVPFLVLEQVVIFWVDDFTCLGLEFKVQGVRFLSRAFPKLRTRWFPEGNAFYFAGSECCSQGRLYVQTNESLK